MPKIGEQIAAIPMKWTDEGELRILMVTSRDTGRWVLPKGWTIDGKKPWQAAEIEALEEAGVVGHISTERLGVYTYTKNDTGIPDITCRVRVYPMIVEKLRSDWKERNQRKRHWFSAKGAAKAVNEPELKDVLLKLAKKPRKHPIIRTLLKAS
jgi:8-oxo-dGTP pyrophosphatase MutT (NUDIX family)